MLRLRISLILPSFLLFFASLACVTLASSLRGQQVQRQDPLSSSIWNSLFSMIATITRTSTNTVGNPFPAHCLEDPDDPACHRRIQQEAKQFSLPSALMNRKSALYDIKDELRTMTMPSPSSSPSSFVTDFPYYEDRMASQAPTRDLCYGNMERLEYKKYCHSEMPSVSLEPSEQPTEMSGGSNGGGGGNPSQEPSSESMPGALGPEKSLSPSKDGATAPPSGSLEPSLHPTLIPSTSPSLSLAPSRAGRCEGDCDSPADCSEGLYCYQRMPYDAVPGCPGTELDGSRTDYCTDVDPPSSYPVPAPHEDFFRLKLCWDSSYMWQGSKKEVEYCMSCPSRPARRGHANGSVTWQDSQESCQDGDSLHIEFCSTESVYFDFIILEDGSTDVTNEDIFMVQIIGTNLCLKREETDVVLERCDDSSESQRWNSPIGDVREGGCFEIGQQAPHDLCVTTHHHPKYGEQIELYPCTVARKDTTSLWTIF